MNSFARSAWIAPIDGLAALCAAAISCSARSRKYARFSIDIGRAPLRLQRPRSSPVGVKSFVALLADDDPHRDSTGPVYPSRFASGLMDVNAVLVG